jgi:hypothetical protein
MNDLVHAPMAGLLKGQDNAIFNQVDDVIQRALTTGDPLIALEFASKLQRDGLLKGLGIAKLMFKLKQNWQLFEVAGIGDSFESMVESQNGYAPATVEKYIRMWESIFENPELPDDIKNQLSGRPIGDLLLLTAASREGSLSSRDWDEVTVASDTSKVKEIIRRARGEVTSSKSALTIMIQMRPDGIQPRGTITVSSNGERCVLGALLLDLPEDSAQKAIARIIQRANIMEI